MQRVIDHQSDPQHYKADACIVWCFDGRFSKLLDQFIQKFQFSHIDLVKVAGGAKDLASPEIESNRAYILDQIAKSIKLNHTQQVVLMAHSECGAYGGSADPDFYSTELIKARAVVSSAFPNVSVVAHFADFNGLQSVE